MNTNRALARFFTQLAAAATELAADLEGPRADEVLAESPVLEGLGSRQRLAYEAVAAATRDLGTAEVAAAIEYDFSNTYMTLRRLEQLGLVELVPGAKPQRWRVRHPDSEVAKKYRAAAELIRAGEWVTYGDISIAVRGDDGGAIAVGRMAATRPDFPNPHRVLRAGGVIPPQWHDDNGAGPEACRHRLEAERVSFDDKGRADQARRVSYEELRDRLRHAGVQVPEPTDA
jgi:alkylated DNA nucleotide flippase Atl1